MRIKLSDAIIKGREKRPQIRGNYKKKLRKPVGEINFGTCDVGAAYEGITGQLPPYMSSFKAYQLCLVLVESCDLNNLSHSVEFEGKDYENILNLLVELNDKYKWSTEKTVTWLKERGL